LNYISVVHIGLVSGLVSKAVGVGLLALVFSTVLAHIAEDICISVQDAELLQIESPQLVSTLQETEYDQCAGLEVLSTELTDNSTHHDITVTESQARHHQEDKGLGSPTLVRNSKLFGFLQTSVSPTAINCMVSM